MAQLQMHTQATALTLLVQFLEMVLEGTMRELLLKLNFISKPWRMITMVISSGLASTTC